MKSLLSMLHFLLSMFIAIKFAVIRFTEDAFALFSPVVKLFEFAKLKVTKFTENTRAVMHEMFMLPTLLRH